MKFCGGGGKTLSPEALESSMVCLIACIASYKTEYIEAVASSSASSSNNSNNNNDTSDNNYDNSDSTSNSKISSETVDYLSLISKGDYYNGLRVSNTGEELKHDIINFFSSLSEFQSFHGVDSGKRPGGNAFTGMMKDGETFFILFRGSKDMEDFEQDFRSFQHTPMVFGTEGTTTATTFNVGTGFKNQYLELMDEQGLRSVIDQALRVRSKVLITGHSLGGSNASLCAVDLALRYPHCELILKTFGAMRTFEAKAANIIQSTLVMGGENYPTDDAITSKPGKIAVQRFISYGDVVGSIPPSSLGFRHYGHGLYINRRLFSSLVSCKVQHQNFSAYSMFGFACCFAWGVGGVSKQKRGGVGGKRVLKGEDEIALRGEEKSGKGDIWVPTTHVFDAYYTRMQLVLSGYKT